MEISGIDEDQLIDKIVDRLVIKLIPRIDDAVNNHEDSDDLLTQKDVYTGILHCVYNTFVKHYLSDPTFPRRYQGDRMVFSRKAVNEWLDNDKNKHREA